MNIKEIIGQHKKNKSLDTPVVQELAKVLLNSAIQPIIQEFNEKIEKMTSEFNEEIEKLKKDLSCETVGIKECFKEEVDKIQNDLDKKGDKGEKGDNGKDGLSIKGEDGKDGKNGLDGIGKDGKDGKDGSPDMPNQIADKLNLLEQKVEQKVIVGLEKTLRSLQLNIQDNKRLGNKNTSGGGGGIGNPTSESFTMNGSSTTFTLTNNVQANGKAIWVYNNGQWLVPTTHYSISGKVGTLTFTPQNGEIIDVLYFRA